MSAFREGAHNNWVDTQAVQEGCWPSESRPTLRRRFELALGMEQHRHDLQSCGQPRAGTGKIRVGVDSKDIAATHRLQLFPLRRKLSFAIFAHGPFQVISTGHNE